MKVSQAHLVSLSTRTVIAINSTGGGGYGDEQNPISIEAIDAGISQGVRFTMGTSTYFLIYGSTRFHLRGEVIHRHFGTLMPLGWRASSIPLKFGHALGLSTNR